MDRRDFLKTSALVSASSLLALNRASAQAVTPKSIVIHSQVADSMKARLAARELFSGLHMLNPALEVRQASGDASHGATVLSLVVDSSRFKGTEEYEIASSDSGAVLRAASEQALLFAVFEFLERQGLVFGIDGTTAPIDRPAGILLPREGQPWTASPCFAVRGLLPWPDFLNCISIYNDEDFKAYFAAMLRMRFNMFGMHVYTENEPGPLAESYLSYEFAGSGHRVGPGQSALRPGVAIIEADGEGELGDKAARAQYQRELDEDDRCKEHDRQGGGPDKGFGPGGGRFIAQARLLCSGHPGMIPALPMSMTWRKRAIR